MKISEYLGLHNDFLTALRENVCVNRDFQEKRKRLKSSLTVKEAHGMT